MHILSSRFRAANPNAVRDVARRIRAVPNRRRNLVALAVAAARHSAEPALKDVSAQTLLLFGGLDPIAGRASEAELLDDLPRSTLEVLPDVGHDLSLEAPILAADRILCFLR
jgi:pimeloyl-ACP methyl ester carboxylesterase